ncbi:hypothetical protein AGRA3207_000791 [Actinomadura graeca]|uniref:Tetracycline repressor TetR C-terminal domain-containing protein n=1 Tax=Actinomadura graeca TaxID=2750812 RepID=A0ABX8QQU7_9ACTN|nr:hypothetical protein [Actinomadura graeca]QXJ20137.1 hypothetical protein AGRA3207_000791 [Actinomadura graeca]
MRLSCRCSPVRVGSGDARSGRTRTASRDRHRSDGRDETEQGPYPTRLALRRRYGPPACHQARGARGAGEDARASAAGYLERDRGRYPSLAAHGHLGGHDWDAAFAQGLGHLLDGIAGAAPPGGRPGPGDAVRS